MAPELEFDTVRRHTQSVVSHKEIIASEPPTATYFPFGQYEMAMQDEVCAEMAWRGWKEGKSRI
jgi:hypothetical protein